MSEEQLPEADVTGEVVDADQEGGQPFEGEDPLDPAQEGKPKKLVNIYK
jgi:hypothetical protein